MVHFRKRHVLFLAVLGALLLIFELVLRLATPLPLTDFSQATWDPHLLYRVPKIIGANENGFREDSDPETAAIAAIGDSFTFGLGVDASKSWPELVESMSGKTVYNYSAPSYNIYQYYYLTQHALELGAEEIIVGFYPANDLRLQVCRILELDYWRSFMEEEGLDPSGCAEPEQNFEDFQKAEGVGMAYSLSRWGLNHSALFCVLYAATAKVRHVLPYDKERFVFAEGIPFSKARMKYRIYQTDSESELIQAGYRNSQKLFLKMRDLAADRGARFMVLLIPTKFQLARDFLRTEGAEVPELLETGAASVQRLEDAYLEFFQDNGIPALSGAERLGTLYRKSIHEGDDIYPRDDEHPREEGYAAIAEVAMELRARNKEEEK